VNGNGTISTIAGTGASGSYSGEGGIATSAVIPAPASNLMVDSEGNVVISATAANLLLKVASATAPALNLGTTTPGTTSAAQFVTVLNNGNSALSFSGVTASADFTVQSTGLTDCAATTSLAPGQTCSLGIAFSPDSSALGALSGTVTLTDNALNGANVTQTIALSGNAKFVLSTTTSVNVSPASPLIYGTPASITATVTNGNAATGTVNFTVNGTSIGNATLSNNQATLVLPNLPVGMASITASYSGDNNNGSSSGKTSMTIQPAMLTVTAGNATLSWGATALPQLTFTISGFVNGDPRTAVSGAPTETTTATVTSAAGMYPITVTQGTLAASNYTFNFVNGTLTVLPEPSADFTFAVTPSVVTVIAGTSGLATLTLTPQYGYSGTVSLSCGSLPANISCAFTGPLAGNAQGNPVWTQVQIYTNGKAATTTTSSNNIPFSAPRTLMAMGMPLCFFGIALCRGRRAWKGRLLGLLLLAGVTVGMSSCSSGASTEAAAPTGTYQISVTATDTSAKLSHTAAFTLTIQ
jgi:hypothetical protein